MVKTQGIEKKLNKVVDSSVKSVEIFTDLVQSLKVANESLATVAIDAGEHADYYSDVRVKALKQIEDNNSIREKVEALLNN